MFWTPLGTVAAFVFWKTSFMGSVAFLAAFTGTMACTILWCRCRETD